MKMIGLITNTLLVDKLKLEAELEELLNNLTIPHNERLEMCISTLKELNEVINAISLWESFQQINNEKQKED
jgi:hypothetical protein|tara:strand:- start:3645 stop:3860 length:216 start_codon:yes stop_codon:yes gene_type:complete